MTDREKLEREGAVVGDEPVEDTTTAEEHVEEVTEHVEGPAEASSVPAEEGGETPEPDDVDDLTIELPDHPVLAELARAFPQAAFSQRVGEDVAEVSADDLVAFMAACRDAGYTMFSDLAAVDYLRRVPRFEVVTTVYSLDPPHRLRVHVGADGPEPTLPSISSVYAGANFFEREAFDLFGIVFDDHPDLTRILLPDDWEGHPLRKDYAVGSVPVQFKGAHKAR